MRLIDADALIEKCGDWYVEEGPEEGFIGTIKRLIDAQPTIEPETNCSEIPNNSDTISRQRSVDALRDYLVEKRCPDDGTLTCRLIENEVINKLPSVQSDDDRLKRCRFEYVNACKILAHRTPDTSKKDINDAYAVVKALNPIFGEEGF